MRTLRAHSGNKVRGERSLLKQIRSRAARQVTGLRLGIGDDCALLAPKPGEEIAVTTDLSIAGRHFLLEWHRPEVVGHRTLARGLSDLAAMGARPLGAFVSLGLPAELTQRRARQKSWLERFFTGFFELADRCGTPLAGGDLAQSSLALADVVLVGAVPRRRALLRSGARPGDLLYVTGRLGGAAAGLAALQRLGVRSRRVAGAKAAGREAMRAHFYPEPRLAQGLWLQRRGIATAAIDLSDGLSIDLSHLCEESGVAAEIDTARLPIQERATLDQALHGGEDYELLFTASSRAQLPRLIAGVAVTQIGRIVRRERRRPLIAATSPAGQEPLQPSGWEHFA